MQTALHIRSLVNELSREIIGGEIVRTEYFRKLRAAYLYIKSDSGSWAFGFVFHPGGSGVFLVPASKLEIDTSEKPWPLFELAGAKITGVEQIGLDRIFRLCTETTSGVRIVVCEAIGPNGNMWLLDGHHKTIGTLRHKEFDPKATYQPPPAREGLNPFELSAHSLKAELDKLGDHQISVVTFIEKRILGFNRTMAREAAIRARLESSSVAALTSETIGEFSRSIRSLADMFDTDHAAYLHTVRGEHEVYPFKLHEESAEAPEKFKSLSYAVLAMISTRQSAKVEVDEGKVIVAVVAKQVERLEKRAEKIKADIGHAADFEKYKQYGDLLHSNFSRLKRGMKHITVENMHVHPSESIEIPLDSALTPQQNVESYYKKHRKGKEGLELLERRLEVTQQEIDQWRDIAANLESDFESARRRYQEELASLLPKEKMKTAETVRLPYREHTLSTGVTIFIGRDGSDNDRTTFEFAKPFELWFHAQQCPGSHVVMKFPNKSFVPSKREIEETAAITAFHSKAKNDSFVPVIYTERRYVRKPRKAKPGLVTVEKEKSVMVAPRKPAGEK